MPKHNLAQLSAGLLLMSMLLRAASGAEYHVDQHFPAAGDHGSGSAEQPFKTISAAVKAVAAGDTVWVHTGTYRERIAVEQDGTAEKPILISAAPAAEVTVSGADRIRDWTPEEKDGDDAVFSTPWPHLFINWTKRQTQPDDDQHLLIGRCEQVFVQGCLLRQVLKRGAVTRGTFFADTDAKRLYVCASENNDLRKEEINVEASTRQQTFFCKGRYVNLRGLRFRHAANMAQHGAAEFAGADCRIEDCIFERSNSAGASFNAENITAQRCIFQENGQLGFRAERAHNLRLADCICRNNNLKQFARGWEAGGNKLALCRGVLIEHSTFCDNRGIGLWFDIGNEACEVKNCLIANNEDCGIFYEISFGLNAHDNVMLGNGFAETHGGWGMQAGISISSSPDCAVERNLIVGNREGFNFREAARTTPRIDDKAERPVWNHDEVIRGNVLAYNRDAQVWGWFDQKDERHWPVAMQERPPLHFGEGGVDAAQPSVGDAAKAYEAKGKESVPGGMSLETLNIAFKKNVLYAAPGQGLFNWGPAWRNCRTYDALEKLRNELDLDHGSVLAEPGFSDYLTRDLRVPDDGEVIHLRAYPQGHVPGVILGKRKARR